MPDKPNISIVGPGKVGTALGVLAGRGGWEVAAVGGRDLQGARAASEAISPNARATLPTEAPPAGRVVLLTVSDDAIAEVCAELIVSGALEHGPILAHCSGALGSEVLAGARDKCGCSIASMHPLQTFPTVAAALEKLPGAYFFCEGDDGALEVLEKLISDIGGTPVRIGAEGKPLYHAAAVMGCNYLVGLLDAALKLMELSGVEREVSLSALIPLIRATVENVATMGPQAALTGPIARGDVATVGRHLEAFAGQPDLEALYRALGLWTVDLARRKDSIDPATQDALREILTTHKGEAGGGTSQDPGQS